jgi:aminopeptidase N
MTDANAHVTRAGRAADFTLPGAEPHYPPDLQVEPVHLDIALHVKVRERRAEGTVTHTVRARTAGTHRLVLNAVDLDDVAVADVEGRAVTFGYDGS